LSPSCSVSLVSIIPPRLSTRTYHLGDEQYRPTGRHTRQISDPTDMSNSIQVIFVVILELMFHMSHIYITFIFLDTMYEQLDISHVAMALLWHDYIMKQCCKNYYYYYYYYYVAVVVLLSQVFFSLGLLFLRQF
jgi:hypothetical protein